MTKNDPHDLSRVRFVYFDLDDTILDHRGAQDRALEDLHSELDALRIIPLRRVLEVYAKVNGTVWREYAAGIRDKEGTRSGRFELLFEALEIEADPLAAADAYLDAYARHWSLVEGAWEAYSAVRRHFPTGILTNGFAEAQRAKLARFPALTASLSSVIISEEEGLLKPHPELFRLAGTRAGVKPEEIAYVGDSLHSDVVGGLNAGWRVVWYTSGDPAIGEPAVPRFSDWAQLPPLLGVSLR